MRLHELAAQLGGTLDGDGEIEIRGVAGIQDAKSGDLTFLGHPRYESFLDKTNASAVIVDGIGPRVRTTALVVCPNPYLAFQRAMEILCTGPRVPAPGIHPSAEVHESVSIGRDASIGPHAVIERGAVIGAESVIGAGCFVGEETIVGDGSRLYPNVVLRERVEIGRHNIIHAGAVIGDDGFGFAKDGAEHRKIPQVGRVILGDDVEVGANTCIDRATFGETRVESGTRIDNLVQIGHNVRVGRNAILCAQVGVAGSSTIGDRVVAGGQAGVSGHLDVGDGAQLGAKSGVIGNVRPGQRVSGYPARPHVTQLRSIAASRRVPELLTRIERLERRLRELETGMDLEPAGPKPGSKRSI